MLAALTLGLGLRAWFVVHYARVAGDSLIYGDIARNLLQRHVYGFSLDPHFAHGVRPTLIRVPGYPLFLAACFAVFGVDRYGAVLWVQVVVDLGTCLLVSGLAGRLFGRRAGMAGLWLAALCPFTANYVIAPLTETLTLFTIAAAFYCFQRWREALDGKREAWWLVGLGAALAYSVLLRPEQGLLAAALVPAVLLVGNLRKALLVSVLTVLPLVPWAARNWQVFHRVQPLAPRFANDPGEFNPAGFERWYRTWAIDFASTDAVYWHYDGAPIAVGDLPNRAFDSQAQYAETEALLDDYNLTTSSSPDLDVRFDAIARARIKSDPLRYYVSLPVARWFNMTFRPRADMLPVPLEWWRFRAHRGVTVFAWGYAGLSLAYLLLAGATVWRREDWARHRTLVGAMLGFLALRSLLLMTIDNSEPRYTLEFFPVVLVLGAAVFARRPRV